MTSFLGHNQLIQVRNLTQAESSDAYKINYEIWNEDRNKESLVVIQSHYV